MNIAEMRLVESIDDTIHDEDAIAELIDDEIRVAFKETYYRRYPIASKALQEAGKDPRLVAKSRKRYRIFFREMLHRVYGL
jgi:hypothetical protein